MMKSLKLKYLMIIINGSLLFSAMASETDQYLTWNATIKDAGPAFDQLLNDKLKSALKSVNKKRKPYSLKKCRKLSLNLMKKLASSPSLKRVTKFKFQKAHPGRYPVDIFPRKNVSTEAYYLSSIHDKQKATKIKELGRTVRVNGVNFGNDKMTHFVTVGTGYYKKYLKRREAGDSHERALKYAMWRGFQKEATILGLKWGTFSFADLEANYQGFRLAYNICESPNPHVAVVNKRWKVVRPIQMKEYFTPGFDESYNRNYFRPSKLKKVAKVIRKNNYCNQIHSPKMQMEFARHKANTKDLTAQNYSKKLLEIAINSEAAYPNLSVKNSYFPLTLEAQTFAKICSDSLDYEKNPRPIKPTKGQKMIEACPTKQAGFSIRGRILSKTRRDITAAITNFVQYAEDYCYARGKSDFKTASEYKWVKNSQVSSTVPFDSHHINKCLVAKINCI